MQKHLIKNLYAATTRHELSLWHYIFSEREWPYDGCVICLE